jgi:signal peptidase I
MLLLGSVVLFYRNTSGAMEPTLREGDTLVVLIRSRPVAIGDVVVFRYPIRPETVFVQRAIAVGGNIVETYYSPEVKNVSG